MNEQAETQVIVHIARMLHCVLCTNTWHGAPMLWMGLRLPLVWVYMLDYSRTLGSSKGNVLMSEGLHSSLHAPQDPQWAAEAGYDPEIMQRLVEAYAWLKRASAGLDVTESYVQAFALAISCLEPPMAPSLRQRLQAYYAAGTALIGGDASTSGLSYLDEALGLAEDLADWGAWAELAYLHATTDAELFHYRSAIGYLADGLGLLSLFNDARAPRYVSLAVDMRLTLASCHYVVEEYEDATTSLDTADTDATALSASEQRLAAIAWMRALVARWRGDPTSALQQAHQAAATFSTSTSPAGRLSWGRLQTVLADIALDIAETLPQAPSRVPESFLHLGGRCAQDAISYTHTNGDKVGKAMAGLAQARFQRLAGRPVNTVPSIERTLRTATQCGDVALLAQGYTTLGFELLSGVGRSNAPDAGLNCFRKALEIVHMGDVPAMAAWARRALLVASR